MSVKIESDEILKTVKANHFTASTVLDSRRLSESSPSSFVDLFVQSLGEVREQAKEKSEPTSEKNTRSEKKSSFHSRLQGKKSDIEDKKVVNKKEEPVGKTIQESFEKENLSKESDSELVMVDSDQTISENTKKFHSGEEEPEVRQPEEKIENIPDQTSSQTGNEVKKSESLQIEESDLEETSTSSKEGESSEILSEQRVEELLLQEQPALDLQEEKPLEIAFLSSEVVQEFKENEDSEETIFNADIRKSAQKSEPDSGFQQSTQAPVLEFHLQSLLEGEKILENPEIKRDLLRLLDKLSQVSVSENENLETIEMNSKEFDSLLLMLKSWVENPSKELEIAFETSEFKNFFENADQTINESLSLWEGSFEIPQEMEIIKEQGLSENKASLQVEGSAEQSLLSDLNVEVLFVDKEKLENVKTPSFSDVLQEDFAKPANEIQILEEKEIKPQKEKKNQGSKEIFSLARTANQLIEKTQEDEKIKPKAYVFQSVNQPVSASNTQVQNPVQAVINPLVSTSSESETGKNRDSRQEQQNQRSFSSSQAFGILKFRAQNPDFSSQEPAFQEKIQKILAQDSRNELYTQASEEVKKVKITRLANHPSFTSSAKVVLGQILDQSRFLQPPILNKIQIQLRPDHLGSVKMEVKQVKDLVKVSFEVESYAVKEIIEKNMSQVRDALKNQGIQTSAIEVEVRQDLQGGSENPERQRQQKQKSGSKNQHQDQIKTPLSAITEEYKVNQYA